MEWKQVWSILAFVLLAMPTALFADGENLPPIVTGVGGPTTLNIGQAGTWSVTANDPDGAYLAYSINWGDGLEQSQAGQRESGSTATFQHTYAQAGAYIITFTVTDTGGASTQASVTTAVALGTQPDLAAYALAISTDSNGVTKFDATVKNVGTAASQGYALAYILDGTEVAVQTAISGIAPGASHANVLQRGEIAAGSHVMKIVVTPSGSDLSSANNEKAKSFQITATANQPPVISANSGPASVIVNQAGTWAIKAYDPDGTYLTYSVNWGEAGATMEATERSTGSTATFQHTYSQPGTYTITFTVTDSAGASTQSSMTVKVVEFTTSNKPPVIEDVDGPTSINAGSVGTWKVAAHDPDGTYLVYGVNWGDTPSTAEGQREASSTATFQHTYSQAGTYAIRFTVEDADGASVHSTYVVRVTGGTSGSDVTASVGAIPTELYQYETVHVVGKVSRGTDATNDQEVAYIVVLSLDNGNSIAKKYAPSPSASAAQSSGASSEVGANSGQVRVEQITLAPGESQEVSAYFTADHLGTNFAKIAVYVKEGSSYRLAASDSTKVLVKQGNGGIPSPPNESIVLKFERGWNMVSVPTEYDIQLSDIQAKCGITSAWYYNPVLGQYSAATTFGKGIVGFWMKASSACTYELAAPYAASWSSPLKAGWNLIGAPASEATLSEVSGDCKVASGLWNYSPSLGQYTYSSKLEPGKGYWIKVDAACTLNDRGDMPPAAPAD
ncbi:MAG: PKD domain-containing protein [Candidatus Micrarchaeia archaeon]